MTESNILDQIKRCKQLLDGMEQVTKDIVNPDRKKLLNNYFSQFEKEVKHLKDYIKKL